MLSIEIPDKEILECTSAKAVLRMSLDRSSNSLKSVAIDLGITESHLSRSLNCQYEVNLRHDLIVPFMTSCGNAIYLRWLFLHLKELIPELDRHTRPGNVEMIGSEIEGLKLMLREAVEEIKKSRATRACPECGSAHFALTPITRHAPAWLVTEALWIDFKMGGDYES